ncbi:hypothetical protein ACFFLZ_12470 [Photobacterium aphoticum]|uniref:hypothetical protein n=1 Tax=Photobacterium aphoticum TaxID=754436 RepID=UPI000B0120D0|nr:hypothetical protein [Photobacterium aphoticum]GHA55036.1 hypothetical protein GCM10007086_31340 [Photobacterium aphoticum]
MIIEPYGIWIGSNCDTEQLLGFSEIEPIESYTFMSNEESCIPVFPMVPVASLTPQQRLTAVLSHALKDNDVDWHSAPVVILLPQFGVIDQSLLPDLYHHICEAIPSLSSHPSCFLYPYGRCAMLLAWQRIEALLEAHSHVWILAVGCDERLCQPLMPVEVVEPSPESGIIATDCVILAKASAASEGLQREWFSYEALTRDKANYDAHAAVSALFSRYQHACSLPISQFYAPYTDEEGCRDEWILAYQYLDRAVDKYTRFIMNGARVGELGACSGLYNVLHLYERYRRGDFRYHSFQLESSELLYRGAALYSWQPY